MPYTTPTALASTTAATSTRVMDECLELARLERLSPRASANRRRTASCAAARSAITWRIGGVFNDRMEIRFDPSGMVTIVAGTHSHGQGHATVYAQIVPEWLGVPFDNIRYVQGDTDAGAVRPRHLRLAQRACSAARR